LYFLQDYGDEVRGCHATTFIEDDEVIIEIPLQCLITVEMGKDTDVWMYLCIIFSPLVTVPGDLTCRLGAQ
jgi:hypothetical protein